MKREPTKKKKKDKNRGRIQRRGSMAKAQNPLNDCFVREIKTS